jgi:hypothetical protein
MNFLLIFDPFVLCHLEQSMLAHLKIILLSFDIEVTIFSDRLKNAAVGIGKSEFDRVFVFNLRIRKDVTNDLS